MNVLDLFSGIGGFSLGLERAGMRTVAFCEIDPYARAVLRKHWPGVPIYDDVRTLTATQLAADGIGVDVICGGFPCQDISFAGKGAGLAGERSGLWREIARLVGELRPRYVIVENVSALLSRGLGDVLGDLAALGYDAEWHCIPASYVGAPHRRDRIWIVAYPGRDGGESDGGLGQLAISAGTGQGAEEERERHGDAVGGSGQDVADADEPGLEGWLGRGVRKCASEWAAREGRAFLSDPDDESEPRRPVHDVSRIGLPEPAGGNGWWLFEPDVGRVAHGVPARVDRLRSLGNAVVPQIPEIIGRAIMAAEHGRTVGRGL